MANDEIPHTHAGPGRRSKPYGRTLDFFRACMELHGKPFCQSWLNEYNCDFTDDTVHTAGIGAERLTARCSELAAEHGVRIRVCQDVRRRFSSVQNHGDLGICSDQQRQYFVHARIKLGLRNYDHTTRSFRANARDPFLLHTTQELAERLNAPPLNKLLAQYGVRVSGDIADVA